MSVRPREPWHHPAPLAIFDLDGTLIDSGANILAGLRATFAEIGLPVPDDSELVHYIGPPVRHSFLARAGLDHAAAEEAGRLYGRISDEHFRDGVTVYSGVPEALDALSARGALLAIATSKPEPQAPALLAEHGLLDRFALVVGFEPTGQRESKAAIISEVLRRADVDTDARGDTDGHRFVAVMVGDREHDLDGAEANGIASAWVAWGYGQAHEGAAATRIVPRVDELAEAVADLLGV